MSICRVGKRLLGQGLAAWRIIAAESICRQTAIQTAVKSFERQTRLRLYKAWRVVATRNLQCRACLQLANTRMQSRSQTKVFAAWRASARQCAALLRAVNIMQKKNSIRSLTTALTAWHEYTAKAGKLRRKLLAMQRAISMRCLADALGELAVYAKRRAAKKRFLKERAASNQASAARTTLQRWRVHAAGRKHHQEIYIRVSGKIFQSLMRVHFRGWQQAFRSKQKIRGQVEVISFLHCRYENLCACGVAGRYSHQAC